MPVGVALLIILGIWFTFSAGVYLLLKADATRWAVWLMGAMTSDFGISFIVGFLLTLSLGLWAARRRI
jgi:hypothetical protein